MTPRDSDVRAPGIDGRGRADYAFDQGIALAYGFEPIGAPDALETAFFGPAAKLFCLRRPRTHPWVLGTSFHQSCGTELKAVAWDESAGTLSGEGHRPVGEWGTVVTANVGHMPVECLVDGHPVPLRTGAGDSTVIPSTVEHTPMRWELRYT